MIAFLLSLLARVTGLSVAAKLAALVVTVSAVAGGAVWTAHNAGDRAARLELAPIIAAQKAKIAAADAVSAVRSLKDAEAERAAKAAGETHQMNERTIFVLRDELERYRSAEATRAPAKKPTKGNANVSTCGPAIPAFAVERVRQLK